MDRLVINIVPDATTRYAKLQAGSCDLILFPECSGFSQNENRSKSTTFGTKRFERGVYCIQYRKSTV